MTTSSTESGPAARDANASAISARVADAADIEELVRLEAAARAAMADLRGGELHFLRDARPAPAQESFARDIDDPDRLVLVGSIHGQIVGFAVVNVLQLAPDYKLAEIGEIFVEDGARDVGVGEAIMTASIGWATAQGCHGLDSRALPGDRATKNFFESNGLVARAILVHRDLRNT